MTIAPEIIFRLPGRLRVKKDRVVAHCPGLDIRSQGRTSAEAKSNLRDAVISFLDSCWRRRTLDEVLRECGMEPGSRSRRLRSDFEFEVRLVSPSASRRAA